MQRFDEISNLEYKNWLPIYKSRVEVEWAGKKVESKFIDLQLDNPNFKNPPLERKKKEENGEGEEETENKETEAETEAEGAKEAEETVKMKVAKKLKKEKQAKKEKNGNGDEEEKDLREEQNIYHLDIVFSIILIIIYLPVHENVQEMKCRSTDIFIILHLPSKLRQCQAIQTISRQ